MFELKKLSIEAVPQAIEKAKHYRLLNQPWQTESICRDILDADPDHHQARSTLILALTDQFPTLDRSREAAELCALLPEEYDQLYHRGLVSERLGRASLNKSGPRVKYIAYQHYRRALDYYDQAEKCRSEGNYDVVLRWNACLRIMAEFKLEPSPEEDHFEALLDA